MGTLLHELGHAHSVECWNGDRLAGGLYGVCIGGLFAGESMFHRVRDASKAALVHLVERLRAGPFDAIVCRAFASIADFVAATRPLLRPGGRWYAMKGQRPDAELRDLGWG